MRIEALHPQESETVKRICKAYLAGRSLLAIRLQQQLGDIRDGQLKREQTRLDDIYTILDGLKNRPMEDDEQIVRQLLECVTVDSKEQPASRMD